MSTSLVMTSLCSALHVMGVFEGSCPLSTIYLPSSAFTFTHLVLSVTFTSFSGFLQQFKQRLRQSREVLDEGAVVWSQFDAVFSHVVENLAEVVYVIVKGR